MLRPRFRKSFDLQISSLVGYVKKENAFPSLRHMLSQKLFTVNGLYIEK